MRAEIKELIDKLCAEYEKSIEEFPPTPHDLAKPDCELYVAGYIRVTPDGKTEHLPFHEVSK